MIFLQVQDANADHIRKVEWLENAAPQHRNTDYITGMSKKLHHVIARDKAGLA